jgi:hypothetical protein
MSTNFDTKPTAAPRPAGWRHFDVSFVSGLKKRCQDGAAIGKFDGATSLIFRNHHLGQFLAYQDTAILCSKSGAIHSAISVTHIKVIFRTTFSPPCVISRYDRTKARLCSKIIRNRVIPSLVIGDSLAPSSIFFLRIGSLYTVSQSHFHNTRPNNYSRGCRIDCCPRQKSCLRPV